MKLALGFWGITRSLKYTIQSIQQHILSPLLAENHQITIFMHTFRINSVYNNIRTGESNVSLDNDEYKLLHPHHIKIDDQDEIKRKIDMALYRTHPDPWNTNYNSVDNFICAMYSKNELTQMIENADQSFDYILFLRPDVKFLNRFNSAFLRQATVDTICIPNFAIYYNFNDRFAITTPDTFKTYGTVFTQLLEYSKQHPMHSEHYQSTILRRNNVRCIYLPFYFNRIRCNGYEVIDVKRIAAPITKSATPITNSFIRARPQIKTNVKMFFT